jgi:hypothetical protein
MKIKYLNMGRTAVMISCVTRCAMHFFNKKRNSAVANFSGSHSQI